jgi:hypothetical protein
MGYYLVVGFLIWFGLCVLAISAAFLFACWHDSRGNYKRALRYYPRSSIFPLRLVCKWRIQEIWKNRGPFDYAPELEELARREDPTAGCDEAALIKDIRKLEKIVGTRVSSTELVIYRG